MTQHADHESGAHQHEAEGQQGLEVTRSLLAEARQVRDLGDEGREQGHESILGHSWPASSNRSSARERLGEVGYLADDSAALVSFLAGKLDKPVLVEGPAGVGKTELAKAVSRATGRRLIRLQCYEGLDEAKALYEWNYRKQLLRIQTEASGTGWEPNRAHCYSREELRSPPERTPL